MWPFKKIQLVGPEEFPAVIDALAGKLRSAGFVIEADRFHHLAHEFVATTSNELYGELHLALKKIDQLMHLLLERFVSHFCSLPDARRCQRSFGPSGLRRRCRPSLFGSIHLEIRRNTALASLAHYSM